MEEHEKIELRSDEVQEILGTPPRWIVRWGTTAIFFGIAMLCLSSWLIKYPDVVVLPITITTFVEPVDVIAQRSGHLSQLLVEDEQNVKFGDVLVVIQNQAVLEDVLLLDSMSMELQTYELSEFQTYEAPENLKIGSLQNSYSRFTQVYRELFNEIETGYEGQRLASLENRIKNIRKSTVELEGKYRKAKVEYSIADKLLRSKQKLYSEKVISKNEVDKAASNRANIDKQIQSIRAEIQNQSVAISQIEDQQVTLRLSSDRGRKEKFIELQEVVNKLRSEIGEWKDENLLIAPIEGKIALSSEFSSEQQYMKVGDHILAIIPSKGDRIVAKGDMPGSGLGKVDMGDRVIIRLDAYPYQEYGIIRGRMESKSAIPNQQSQYPVKITLTEELTTTYGKELKFEQRMRGVAEIISEDRRFVERIFDQFRKVFDKY